MTLIWEILLFHLFLGTGIIIALFLRNLVSNKLLLSDPIRLVLQLALFLITVAMIACAWVYYLVHIMPKLGICSNSLLGFMTILEPLFVAGVIAAIFNKLSGYK